jgi:hypothetical protein
MMKIVQYYTVASTKEGEIEGEMSQKALHEKQAVADCS